MLKPDSASCGRGLKSLPNLKRQDRGRLLKDSQSEWKFAAFPEVKSSPGGVVPSADRVIRCRPAPARCEQIWKQVSDSRCSASTGNYSARSPSKVNACPTVSASACGSAWLRATARRLRVPFPRLLWCRRQELGELTSRLHYHGLIAGLPPDALCPSLNFELMAV